MELQNRQKKVNQQETGDSLQQEAQDPNIDGQKSEQFEDDKLLIDKDNKWFFLRKKSVVCLTLLAVIVLSGIVYLSISPKQSQNLQVDTLQMSNVYDLVVLNSLTGLCLDGSPGAYYISRSGDPNNVYIYFQGGAWCGDANYQQTLENCYQRSNSFLGSSKYSPPQRQFNQGVLSNKTQNYFRNWKKVYFSYCDGSGHQGSRKQPIIYKNTTLYFRGHNATVQKLESLQQKIGLFSQAKNIVVSGQSAGGLASFTWTDYVAERAKNAKVYGLPGSGIFYDSMNYHTKEHNFRKQIINIMNITNEQIDHPVTGCVKEYSNEKYKCMFAQYLYQHVKTPIFVVQSLYDGYQIPMHLGVRCEEHLIKNCNEEKAKIVNQHRKNVQDLLRSIGENNKNGVWGVACVGHLYLNQQKFFSKNFEISQFSGNQISKTFQNWIENSTSNHVFIDQVQWPNNKPCSYDLF